MIERFITYDSPYKIPHDSYLHNMDILIIYINIINSLQIIKTSNLVAGF